MKNRLQSAPSANLLGMAASFGSGAMPLREKRGLSNVNQKQNNKAQNLNQILFNKGKGCENNPSFSSIVISPTNAGSQVAESVQQQQQQQQMKSSYRGEGSFFKSTISNNDYASTRETSFMKKLVVSQRSQLKQKASLKNYGTAQRKTRPDKMLAPFISCNKSNETDEDQQQQRLQQQELIYQDNYRRSFSPCQKASKTLIKDSSVTQSSYHPVQTVEDGSCVPSNIYQANIKHQTFYGQKSKKWTLAQDKGSSQRQKEKDLGGQGVGGYFKQSTSSLLSPRNKQHLGNVVLSKASVSFKMGVSNGTTTVASQVFKSFKKEQIVIGTTQKVGKQLSKKKIPQQKMSKTQPQSQEADENLPQFKKMRSMKQQLTEQTKTSQRQTEFVGREKSGQEGRSSIEPKMIDRPVEGLNKQYDTLELGDQEKFSNRNQDKPQSRNMMASTADSPPLRDIRIMHQNDGNISGEKYQIIEADQNADGHEQLLGPTLSQPVVVNEVKDMKLQDTTNLKPGTLVNDISRKNKTVVWQVEKGGQNLVDNDQATKTMSPKNNDTEVVETQVIDQDRISRSFKFASKHKSVNVKTKKQKSVEKLSTDRKMVAWKNSVITSEQENVKNEVDPKEQKIEQDESQLYPFKLLHKHQQKLTQRNNINGANKASAELKLMANKQQRCKSIDDANQEVENDLNEAGDMELLMRDKMVRDNLKMLDGLDQRSIIKKLHDLKLKSQQQQSSTTMTKKLSNHQFSTLAPFQNYTSTNDNIYKETIEARKIREAIGKMGKKLKNAPVSIVEKKKQQRLITQIEQNVAHKTYREVQTENSPRKSILRAAAGEDSSCHITFASHSPSPCKNLPDSQSTQKWPILDSEDNEIFMTGCKPLPVFEGNKLSAKTLSIIQPAVPKLHLEEVQSNNGCYNMSSAETALTSKFLYQHRTLDAMMRKNDKFQHETSPVIKKEKCRESQGLAKLAENFTNKKNFQQIFMRQSDAILSPKGSSTDKDGMIADNAVASCGTMILEYNHQPLEVDSEGHAVNADVFYGTSSANVNSTVARQSVADKEDRSFFMRMQRQYSQKQLLMSQSKKPVLLFANQPQIIRKESPSKMGLEQVKEQQNDSTFLLHSISPKKVVEMNRYGTFTSLPQKKKFMKNNTSGVVVGADRMAQTMQKIGTTVSNKKHRVQRVQSSCAQKKIQSPLTKPMIGNLQNTADEKSQRRKIKLMAAEKLIYNQNCAATLESAFLGAIVSQNQTQALNSIHQKSKVMSIAGKRLIQNRSQEHIRVNSQDILNGDDDLIYDNRYRRHLAQTMHEYANLVQIQDQQQQQQQEPQKPRNTFSLQVNLRGEDGENNTGAINEQSSAFLMQPSWFLKDQMMSRTDEVLDSGFVQEQPDDQYDNDDESGDFQTDSSMIQSSDLKEQRRVDDDIDMILQNNTASQGQNFTVAATQSMRKTFGSVKNDSTGTIENYRDTQKLSEEQSKDDYCSSLNECLHGSHENVNKNDSTLQCVEQQNEEQTLPMNMSFSMATQNPFAPQIPSPTESPPIKQTSTVFSYNHTANNAINETSSWINNSKEDDDSASDGSFASECDKTAKQMQIQNKETGGIVFSSSSDAGSATNLSADSKQKILEEGEQLMRRLRYRKYKMRAYDIEQPGANGEMSQVQQQQQQQQQQQETMIQINDQGRDIKKKVSVIKKVSPQLKRRPQQHPSFQQRKSLLSTVNLFCLSEETQSLPSVQEFASDHSVQTIEHSDCGEAQVTVDTKNDEDSGFDAEDEYQMITGGYQNCSRQPVAMTQNDNIKQHGTESSGNFSDHDFSSGMQGIIGRYSADSLPKELIQFNKMLDNPKVFKEKSFRTTSKEGRKNLMKLYSGKNIQRRNINLNKAIERHRKVKAHVNQNSNSKLLKPQ